MDNYRIKNSEAIAVITNLLCNKLFVVAPYYLKQSSGNAVIITLAFYYLIAFCIFRICINYYPEKKDILDIASKPKKITLGTSILLAICIVTTLSLRQFSEGTKVMTMQKSPVTFIGGIFGLGMIFGAICGIKSIAKTSNIFVPIIYSIAVLLAISTIKLNDLNRIFPIFGEGLNIIIPQSSIILSMLFEVVIIFILPSFLHKPNDLKKIGSFSFFWSFVIFFIIGGIYCITSSESSNIESYEPFFRMIKQIEFSNFIQRFDSLFLILYCLSAFLYLSTSLYFLTVVAAKTFSINDRKFLTIPIGVIIICSSFANYLQEYMFSITGKANSILWIVAFIVPFLSLIKFRRIK